MIKNITFLIILNSINIFAIFPPLTRTHFPRYAQSQPSRIFGHIEKISLKYYPPPTSVKLYHYCRPSIYETVSF